MYVVTLDPAGGASVTVNFEGLQLVISNRCVRPYQLEMQVVGNQGNRDHTLLLKFKRNHGAIVFTKRVPLNNNSPRDIHKAFWLEVYLEYKLPCVLRAGTGLLFTSLGQVLGNIGVMFSQVTLIRRMLLIQSLEDPGYESWDDLPELE